MMPLEVDEESDYDTRRAASDLDAIAAWIAAGAPDINGNTAPANGASLPPQIHGFAAFLPDVLSGVYPRAEGMGIQPVLVEALPIQVFIAVTDDQLPMTSLSCSWAIGVDAADARRRGPRGRLRSGPFTFDAPTFSGSTEVYGLSAKSTSPGIPRRSELTPQLRAEDGEAEARSPLPTSPEYIQLLYRLRIAP